jgi:hypothetical protein
MDSKPHPDRWGKTEKRDFTVVNEDFEDDSYYTIVRFSRTLLSNVG